MCVCIIRGIGKREMQEMQKKKEKRIIVLLIGPNNCLLLFLKNTDDQIPTYNWNYYV